MLRCTRRVFVAATTAFGAVGSSGARAEDTLAEDLVRVFRNRRSAQAVGREYLRRAPAEADRSKLVSLIHGHRGEPPPRDRGLRALQEWIGARQQKDFAEERVVEVQGWILSATEARLCALSVLT